MRSGDSPFRWWVFDDWCDPIATAPPESARWEVRYDNELEKGKRTTRALAESGPGFAEYVPTLRVMRSLAGEWSKRLGYDVYDDPHLHGGGLHVTKPGGHLATHLDYALHPRGAGVRALNLIAFTHPKWEPQWGGQLQLCHPSGEIGVAIDPKPGRLVAFEVSDVSYHGVGATTADAEERVSLAVYYLCKVDTERKCDRRAHTRTRALFMPIRK